jgi:putative nucleotidyltransferase-like protein
MALSKDPRLRLRDFLVSGNVPSPASGDDAETLAATAREQGLVGLLHTAILSSSGPGTWPSRVREGLRDTHRALLVRGVRQLERAAEVQEHLLRRGLRVLPLKGAAVAESLYDTVADRPMGDVDLLALDDWPGSVRLLEEMGFRETARGDHARAFVDPASGSALELHHALTSCPGLFPIDREGLWRRGLPGSGALGLLPAPEDLLVHLSLHAAFQHGLVLSLVQYLDFRRVLERLRPDPAVIRQRAADARAETALAIALRVAGTVVGATPPFPPDPNSLDAWLEARSSDATRFLVPAAPALAHVRFGVASGQRLRLVLRTMASAEPGDRRSSLERGRAVVRRTVHLVGLLLAGATASLRALPAAPLPSVRPHGEAPS